MFQKLEDDLYLELTKVIKTHKKFDEVLTLDLLISTREKSALKFSSGG